MLFFYLSQTILLEIEIDHTILNKYNASFVYLTTVHVAPSCRSVSDEVRSQTIFSLSGEPVKAKIVLPENVS